MKMFFHTTGFYPGQLTNIAETDTVDVTRDPLTSYITKFVRHQICSREWWVTFRKCLERAWTFSGLWFEPSPNSRCGSNFEIATSIRCKPGRSKKGLAEKPGRLTKSKIIQIPCAQQMFELNSQRPTQKGTNGCSHGQRILFDIKERRLGSGGPSERSVNFKKSNSLEE